MESAMKDEISHLMKNYSVMRDQMQKLIKVNERLSKICQAQEEQIAMRDKIMYV